jgi:Protein of unknown function (DUF3303)
VRVTLRLGGGCEIQREPDRRQTMQFMTTWTLREGNGDASERIAEGKKILEAFGRWAIPEGEKMIAFVARADGNGGCAISESDDATALADAAAKFSA